MKKYLLRLSMLMLCCLPATLMAGENDLTWDYTEAAPSANPDNGLYYASKVSDAAGTNNGLKGIKLNSSGYAYFAKAAVEGQLTLTIGRRSGSGAYAVNVYTCTGADGAKGAKGELIGEVSVTDGPARGSIDIPADVTGIWIERKTSAEGVLSKITFRTDPNTVETAVITFKDQNGNKLGEKTVNQGDPVGEIPYTEANLTIPTGQKFRGWVYTNKTKVKATDTVNGDLTIQASVTDIETAPTVGSVQTYDLTQPFFYPEDHENFSVNGGSYYNNHGFTFNAGGSFSVKVTGKAQIVLTLCQYGNGTTITVTDAAGNVIRDDVPAKAATDGGTTAVNYTGEATTLTFTFANSAYLHKVNVYNVHHFIEKDEATNTYNVPAGDGAGLILAINSANTEGGCTIYLPNGTYDLGNITLTAISGNNITIKGESQQGVVIQNLPTEEGIGVTATLLNTSQYLTLETLTLKNALPYYDPNTGKAAGSAGRAVCLQDKGNYTVCRNVTMLSYQDTYYSNNANGLFYFKDCEIHGLVDFVCGGGDVYYENTLFYLESREVSENKGDVTIAAPNGAKKFGYVMDGCTVDCHSATFNWGRAWGSVSNLAWLNTTLKQPSKIVSTRFTTAGMNSAADGFYEYKTVNEQGQVVSPSSNKLTFTHSTGNKEYETILTDEQAAGYTKDKVFADAPQEFKNRVGLGDNEGIHDVLNTTDTHSADVVYDLQGRRTAHPAKGLYIVGQKKVVVK